MDTKTRINYNKSSFGVLAQLIERGIRIAEVAGLIPAHSTIMTQMTAGHFLLLNKKLRQQLASLWKDDKR